MHANESSDTCQWYVPKTVSMNSETSDYLEFKVSCNCLTLSFEIHVYNRWGNALYSSDDVNEAWDVSKVTDGSYFWVIKGTYETEEPFEFNGSVAVITGN